MIIVPYPPLKVLAGNDILDGGAGSDEIYGGSGIDEIKDGNNEVEEINKVYGGSGDDKIDVGTIYDHGIIYYIYGEAGSDYIEVIAHEAYVNGGSGKDTIYCTTPYCAINGNGGDDEIHTTLEGPDSYAHGGSGNDKLYDTVGYELQGNDGNDYLYGGGVMYGDAGDDVLEGAHPDTQYYGGAGADTFKCSSTWEHDTVHDYNPAEGDQIVSVADCETINNN
jgi:Ca2+-binding RTX toxin-like protein